MAFTAYRTFVAGEIVTAAMLNQQIRDNGNYLKGVGQVPTIQSGLTIDNSLGSERLLLPLLSTAECATVLNVAGEVAYDEATNRIKMYGAALNSVVTTADVDDTPVNGATTDPVSSNWAYDHIATLTTRGDTIRRNATVWERLALGTSGQYLSSDGTDVVWAAGTLTAGCIVIWAGTIANIPAGYVICDGNGGTPNLLTRFIEGVATAATNPGTTGGATNKTTAGHFHSLAAGTGVDGATLGTSTNTVTDTIADIRPLFYDVAFIMKT